MPRTHHGRRGVSSTINPMAKHPQNRRKHLEAYYPIYIYDIPKLDYKKKKKERTRLKKGKRLKKKKFIQRRHTNDQQTFEKMLNSTNHQGNNNQKDSGILPNTR